tara:strand:- start:69 stop:707 length:639 start_codon:yes stop_codon:yes gene_type:complete
MGIQMLLIFIAYLIGSFPSAVFIGKIFYNKDVREYGSGNAGATNTFRVLGFKAGVPVLFLDIFKGWAAVNLMFFIGELNFNLLFPEKFVEIQIAFGIAAVIGHLFPIYTGFRGGKGIATLLGFLFALNSLAALLCLFGFLICLLITKYVSLSSIVASFIFPIVIYINNDAISSTKSLLVFSIFVPILALITHQKNIERLFRGEENKANFGDK